MPLPIITVKNQLLLALEKKTPVVLKAPTGTGKSTQVPQYALDSGLFKKTILVLEPRRIAARMLAFRVASERGEKVGETVGFQTRFESAVSKKTKIRFITEGILPRMMLSDPKLESVSMVIFDEFHERSLSTDLGLALIKKLKNSDRPDLGVVVMSATIESEELQEYLQTDSVISMDEQLHPVTVDYRPPRAKESLWDAAAAAVRRICEDRDGDILVFMPGAYEIRKTVRAIESTVRKQKLQVYPLYGNLSVERQNAVMEPSDKRKVIVATNIAETSLTIPGIRHVIDSGLARIPRYDPARGFDSLHVHNISMASVKQRTGRAGREAQGSCIRLWKKSIDTTRPKHTDPEIIRVDMTETVLYMRMLGIADPLRFDWLRHPPAAALREAEKTCRDLALIDLETGEITSQGSLIASLPMHPRLAMILTRCAQRGAPEWGALAAAILSERPITTSKQALRNVMRDHGVQNDFVASALLIEEAHKRNYDPTACGDIGVNGSACRQVLRTQQFFNEMIYLHPQVSISESEEPKHIILAKAVAHAYPDHLAKRRDQGTLVCDIAGCGRGELAQESVVRKAPLLIAADIRETGNKQGRPSRTVLSLACEVKREWLEEMFPKRWETERVPVWNNIKKEVQGRERTCCMGVIIEEKNSDLVDQEALSNTLARNIIERKLKLSGWNKEAEELIGRIKKASEQNPEAAFPSFDKDNRQRAVYRLCKGHSRYAEVKSKPAAPVIWEMLTDQQRIILERS